MHVLLLGIGKAIGGALISLFMELLGGKTLKVLLYRPIAWFAGKTKNTLDDQIVQDIKTDWQLTDKDIGDGTPKNTQPADIKHPQ